MAIPKDKQNQLVQMLSALSAEDLIDVVIEVFGQRKTPAIIAAKETDLHSPQQFTIRVRRCGSPPLLHFILSYVQRRLMDEIMAVDDTDDLEDDEREDFYEGGLGPGDLYDRDEEGPWTDAG
jgi:hypothetical protein